MQARDARVAAAVIVIEVHHACPLLSDRLLGGSAEFQAPLSAVTAAAIAAFQ